jgi:hypothetical protein
MKRKRNFQTSIYLALRHMGMLCKVSKPTARKIHVVKTIHPDGRVTTYNAPLDAMPENKYSLQSEIGAFLSDKKVSKPGCKFDVNTQSCVCGHSLNDFLTKTCNNKK